MRKGFKRPLAFVLALITAMSVTWGYLPEKATYANEEKQTDATKEFGANQSNIGPKTKGYGSASLEGATIVEASKYKKIDYSFLKSFPFGTTIERDFLAVYDSVEEMSTSQDYRIRVGQYLKTRGYYKVGDKGGAVYLVDSKSSSGSVKLANGLYAKLVPDETVINGEKYAVVSMYQTGAIADGKTPAQDSFSAAIGVASLAAEKDETIVRGLAYLPEGEYKVTNILYTNSKNTSIVGDGADKTVFFTDNDYRKDYGYSEHLMESWYSENLYFQGFKLEAREVDLYHYMRQFSLFYCKNIYIYDISLVVPESSYRAYEYQDKQYSNMCCYTGNKGVTIDGCYMEQMSGTYRGANLGILDIWSACEENITVMNCKMVGNARDEQIGFFSTASDSAGVKNVDFINNEIIAYRPKYYNVVGTATMRFTVAYTDSKNIDDIRIEGNHFKVECDSKFMTFGNLKKFEMSHNVIEVYTSQNNGSCVFDSSCGDGSQIKIHDNEFYLSSYNASSKSGVIAGHLEFYNNRVFTDISLTWGILGGYKNCDIVAFGYLGGGTLSTATVTPKNSITGNRFSCFNGIGYTPVFGYANSSQDMEFSNNVIYDYKRNVMTIASWESFGMVNSDANKIDFTHNEIYSPNLFVEKNHTSCQLDENGARLSRIFYMRSGSIKEMDVSGNIFQGYKGVVRYSGSVEGFEKDDYLFPDNKYLNVTAKADDIVASQIDVICNGKVTTDYTTDKSSIALKANVYLPSEYDEEGKVTKQSLTTKRSVKWYSSVESIASVSDTGVVTKHMDGDVVIYATTLDGTTNFGRINLHFESAKATCVTLDAPATEEIQVGLRRHYMATVLPASASDAVIWESSNPDVVSINSYGLAEAKALGTATISCRVVDGSGKTAKVKINVIEPMVRTVNLSATSKHYKNSDIGKTLALNPTTSPSNATNPGISKCVSSNTNVATVDQNGLVKLVGPGVCNIKVYAKDETIKKYCTIYIAPAKLSNVTTNATTDSTTASWPTAVGASGYKVYKWNATTNAYEEKTDLGKATTFTDKGLTANISYKYKIVPYIYYGYKLYDYAEGYELTIRTYSETPIDYFGKEKLTTEFNVGTTSSRTIKYYPTSITRTIEDFSWYLEDTSIASIDKVEMNGTGVRVTLTARKEGITNFVLKSKDEKGQSVKMPVAVFNKSIDYTTIKLEASYGNVKISFRGMEDESKITGYLVRRRKGSAGFPFYDVEYVDKNSTKEYECVDIKAPTDAYAYCYIVCPAIKLEDGTIYYGCGCKSVEGEKINYVKIESISTDKKNVTLDVGQNISVNAIINPTEPSYGNVYWSTDNYRYATVSTKTEGSKTATIKGVKPGVTVIKATTMDGQYLDSSITVTVITAKPVISAVKNESGSVKVEWGAVASAEGYYVYRKDTNTGTWKYIGTSRTTSFSDKNVSNGGIYYYAVKSFAGDIKSASSAAKNTVYVKNIFVSELNNPAAGQLVIKYSANDLATGYEIAYCPYSTFGPNTTVNITVTNKTILNKNATGLIKGRTYYVKVRAYKTVAGYTFYSNWSALKNLKLTK